MSEAERERSNEHSDGSSVCENSFSTHASNGKGGKPERTQLTCQMHQVDHVVDAIKAKEEGERGFFVRHSKRQRKDSAVRAGMTAWPTNGHTFASCGGRTS